MSTLLSIAQASSECGITKEVLRKWEERYGFPTPVRDNHGNRLYTGEQVIRLKLIRRLLDDGFRPAKVVCLEVSALIALAAKKNSCQNRPIDFEHVKDVLAWVKSRDHALLRTKLREELAEHGLAAFVMEVMPAMNALVGEAWKKGEIAIRDEHVYTEMVQVLVRGALDALPTSGNSPRMLLTTPDGETHVLGLLMLEAVVSLEGAYCISLGAQSPIDEIAWAAIDFQADIVALSFSANFPKKQINPLLKNLRARLPLPVQLWAGGSGTLDIERAPRGIKFVYSLEQALELVCSYRN